MNKPPLICYNILILFIIIYSISLFYFGYIDFSFKNIVANNLIIFLGVIFNIYFLFKLEGENE